MKEKTDKLLTLCMMGLGVLCAVFAFLFAQNTVSNSAMFDIVFWLLLGIAGVSIAAILYFMFKSIISKGNLVKFLIGVAAAVALVVVLYLISSGSDVSIALLEKNGLTTSGSKLIGACCYMVYLIVIVATVAIIATEVMPKTNKKKKNK
ncbi:MAG: hypothetical protein MJZ99_04830 [Bacteroidales bacterium]|nr:hypothetical protein [Candidatus Colimorpha merdihippi]MCQ2281930.1 hypothetical protein [Bacteroidales bacterium]